MIVIVGTAWKIWAHFHKPEAQAFCKEVVKFLYPNIYTDLDYFPDDFNYGQRLQVLCGEKARVNIAASVLPNTCVVGCLRPGLKKRAT